MMFWVINVFEKYREEKRKVELGSVPKSYLISLKLNF
jgi:hypothetical protein